MRVLLRRLGQAALLLVATLALVLPTTRAYAKPASYHRDRPDVAAQRLAHAVDARGHADAGREAARAMARYHLPGSSAEAGATATVDVPASTASPKAAPALADDLPVRVGPPGPTTTSRSLPATKGRVRVSVTGLEQGRQAGVGSAVVTLDQLDPTAPPTSPVAAVSTQVSQLSVSVDLAGLGLAAGGDWAQRARLVALPRCAATTPELQACQTRTELATSRSGTTLTASVPLLAAKSAGSTTQGKPATSTDQPAASFASAAVAAVGGPSGTSGDYQSFGAAPSSRWAAGGSEGGFSWSYPLRVPSVAGDLEPDLSLDYSSSSVDGRTTSTNNQSSWVGDGWDLSFGSIERQFTTCADDVKGNNTSTRYDLCWAGDNATVSFGTHSGRLVHDKTDPTLWRLRDDDGTRFQKLTGALDGGSYNKEYWKVTTNDGTQYFFGLGKPYDSATSVTNSALQVPVYGNNAGEPCNQATFAASSCLQTWRWNLDHIQDPDGDTVTAYYTKETNRYGHDNNTGTAAYDRASTLSRIEYGQHLGQQSGNAPAQVLFDVGPRCVESSTACGTLTSTTAPYWYDVPQDQLCTSTTSCSGRVSPTFFSSQRLTGIRTQYLSGSSYVPVEQWSLTQTYPDPGDGTSPSLWLQSVQHKAGSVTLPPVTFGGTQMANRIAGIPDTREPYASALNKYRITKVVSETGGETDVNYLPADCSASSYPAATETNTRRCFPVYWADSSAAPSLHWFNKWVVGSVVDRDATGASPTAVKTTYTYGGSPAWTYDDDTYVKAAYRTWGQWRGYGKVQAVLGDPQSPTAQRTDTLYYRGVDGDRLNAAGGTKSVKVTDSEGVAVADDPAFAGDVREEIAYNGPSGPEVEASIDDDSVVATTATGADGISAKMANVTRSRTRTRLSDGSYRRTDQTTAYDTYGFETQTEDLGDVADPNDDTCDRTTYSRNLSAWILDTPKTTQGRATTCAKWPGTPSEDQVLDESRYYYDGSAALGDVSAGHVTKTEVARAVSGTSFDYVTESSATYDSFGRAVSSKDALQRESTTAYTPTTTGVLTQVKTATPDPDGSGPLAPHVTTTTLDPRFSEPTTVVGPDGSKTETTYDDLGRPTGVWEPGRVKGTDTPDTAYSYTVSSTSASSMTTRSLLPNGQQGVEIALLDGLGRSRQTQSQALDGGSTNGTVNQTSGRLIADTVYNDQGEVAEDRGPTFVASAVSTSLASIAVADVAHRTLHSYDGAGRETRQSLVVGGTTKWSTTTAYGGDRVMVTPPAGGTPTTTISDAEGRTTELRQHTDGTTTGPYEAVQYRYTPSGDLASMTDAAGNTWTHKYDLLGRETESDDPDTGKTTTTYDLEDQVRTTTDARGRTLDYVYDNLGRVTELHDASDTGPLRSSWTYDTQRVGYQTSATRMLWGQAVTSRTTARDAAGRPTSTETTVPAISGLIGSALAGTYASSMTYYPDGSPKTQTLPKAGSFGVTEQLQYGYDDLGRPNSLNGLAPYVAGSVYSGYDDLLQTASGRTGSMTYVTRTVDEGTGRLSTLQLDRDSVPKADEAISYGYNDAGAITKISAAQPQSGAATDTQCFTLDPLQRLTRAWTPSSGDCTQAPTAAGLGGPAPYWTDWTFDKASNRTKQVRHATAGDTTTTWAVPTQGSGVVRPHGATATSVTPPGGATTTSALSYDASGNVTGRTSTAAAVLRSSATGQTLTYDSEGNLSTAATTGASPTTVTYAYDADGDQLVRKDATSTTLYLGDTELKLDQASGTVATTRYYDFAGQTVAVRTGTGSDDVSSLWSELNGTASWQVDWKTNVVTAKRTMPYGEPRDPVPPSAIALKGTHGFVDGIEDAVLGMVNVGARDYDPASGRFLSVDPLIDLADPQTWNGYLYGDGNPVSHPDPSGLMNVNSGGGCGGPHSENGCGGGNSHPVHGHAHHKKHKAHPKPKSGHVSGHIVSFHPHKSHYSYGGGHHKGYGGSSHHGGGGGHGGGRGGGGSHHHAASPPKPKPPSYAGKYRAAERRMAQAAPSFNSLADDINGLIPLGPFPDAGEPLSAQEIWARASAAAAILTCILSGFEECGMALEEGEGEEDVAADEGVGMAEKAGTAEEAGVSAERSAEVPFRADTKHIFRPGHPGHLQDDTPQNRALLRSAIAPENLVREHTLDGGNGVLRSYRSLQPDGTQVWVEVRNGVITNGGVNVKPK